MRTSNLAVRSSFTALALLLTTAAACGKFSDPGGDGPGESPPSESPPSGDNDSGDGPKAPPVKGTPPNDTITEEHGVFVAPSGRDTNDGARARPLATLNAAITVAAKAGKIVFACTGKYPEALVVSDSISVIGGLDCADPSSWKTGAAASRIESPTSPAVTARSITTETRLESLDIVAPDVSAPSASSIGLFADHAAKLTVASSTITAGNGANGTNGAAGVQLTPSVARGAASRAQFTCPQGVARNLNPCWNGITNTWLNVPGGAGGDGTCGGADGHNASPGSRGGAGGMMESVYFGSVEKPNPFYELVVNGDPNYTDKPGGAGTGAAGVDGTNGAPASALGTLTADGYVPQDGRPGTDGQPGAGGHGGAGTAVTGTPTIAMGQSHAVVAGQGGPGGGAGGCPGLAGGAGTGGGASLGVALLESAVVLDGVTVTAKAGGIAGRGTFGGTPSDGGEAGTNQSSDASKNAAPGGRGGLAGLSTNGASGPSIGILVSGGAPIMKGSTKATPGNGGAALPGLTIYMLGIPRTIPGTPEGLSVDIKTL